MGVQVESLYNSLQDPMCHKCPNLRDADAYILTVRTLREYLRSYTVKSAYSDHLWAMHSYREVVSLWRSKSIEMALSGGLHRRVWIIVVFIEGSG